MRVNVGRSMEIGAAEGHTPQIGTIQNGVTEIDVGEIGTYEARVGRLQSGGDGLM
jgi:hypothetical protein